jgi:hypothetical protein
MAVNSAVVPVVARDSQGRAVDGLEQEDFEVVDNNKTHAIPGDLLRAQKVATKMIGGSLANPIWLL